ncbi:MAG: hypothetical protein ACWA6U_16845 [Breznakibacter sp.]
MKKTLFLILTVLYAVNLSAQFSKGDMLISVDGNYSKTNTVSGVTTNLFNSNDKNLNFGASMGFFVNNHVLLGFGVDYSWEKATQMNMLSLDNKIQVEEMNTKTNLILPNAFVGLYYPILERLYVNTNLKLSYGVAKSDYNTFYAGTSNMNDTDQFQNATPPYASNSEGDNSYHYFSTQIYPEITWFATSKVGLSLGLGGIGYAITDWESNTSSWMVNFNPNVWKLGVKIRL